MKPPVNLRADLIASLQHSRSKMMAQLRQIDLKREIYQLWTIREMLAHLSGWDESAIGFLQSIMAGQIPATPADRGIDFYNVQTLAKRADLDYDQIYREFIETRALLLKLIDEVPEEKITAEFILPWGDPGTLVDIVVIFVEHEEEHAEDIEKIIATAGQNSKPADPQ